MPNGKGDYPVKCTLTVFEMAMSHIFHLLYGSDGRPVQEQIWWKDIQDLKKAAWMDYKRKPEE